MKPIRWISDQSAWAPVTDAHAEKPRSGIEHFIGQQDAAARYAASLLLPVNPGSRRRGTGQLAKLKRDIMGETVFPSREETIRRGVLLGLSTHSARLAWYRARRELAGPPESRYGGATS